MANKSIKWQQHKAKKAKNWTRFEMKLHGNSAKEFSLKLTGIQNDREMYALIIQSILSKYSIYHPMSGRPSKPTKLMQEEVRRLMDRHVNNVNLIQSKSKHNELARSFDYLNKSSGLIGFLTKVYWLFGKDEMLKIVDLFIEEAYRYYDYLDTLVEEEATNVQYDFFDFIQRFKNLHPNYLDFEIQDWLNHERILNNNDVNRVKKTLKTQKKRELSEKRQASD